MQKLNMVSGPLDNGNGFFAVVSEPRECACNRMTFFFINRDGKTRCIECDDKYKQEKGE